MDEAFLAKAEKYFEYDFEMLIKSCYREFASLTDQINFLERSKVLLWREFMTAPDERDRHEKAYNNFCSLVDAEIKFWDDVQKYKQRTQGNRVIQPLWPNVNYGRLIERLCIMERVPTKLFVRGIKIFAGNDKELERIYLELCLVHLRNLHHEIEESPHIRHHYHQVKYRLEDLRLITSESTAGKKLQKFLQQFENLKWTDIIWTFIPEQEVLLKIRDQQTTFTYLELGLEDSRKAGKPRLITILLKEGFAQQYGKLNLTERTRLKEKQRTKKTISELRKYLKNTFLVGQNPIVYDREEKAYKIKIEVTDQTEVDYFDDSGEYSP